VKRMINSYKEITGRYLRINKKRTALTLIGIILSVSLISSIGFFFKSMQETEIQNMKNTYGSWHIMYSNADDSLITKIKSNPVVLRSGTYTMGEAVNIDDKLKVREVYGSDDGLRLLPYKLKDGRFPERTSEVAMEKWFIDRMKKDVSLGDKIEILDKEYTLVGILNNSLRNQNDGIGELLVNDPNANMNQRALLVELDVNRKLRDNLDELKKLWDEELVMENELLIMFQGTGMPLAMIFLMSVIIAIVVISTIAVIYNAFQISVVERVKQFGLLRAVGTTPKQIRKIILREATLLALIGIPPGLFFGVLALYGIDIAFRMIAGENMVFRSPTISLDITLGSILVALLSIYASALLPAIFAGRISPLVAISSRNSITKEKLKRRKSFIIGKIFGFEGVLASKGIKRNRKRYRITVFSIIISVTLFISFKSFMDMSLNVYSELNESSNMHFSVMSNGDRTKIDESLIEEINNLPYLDTSYRAYNAFNFDTVIDKSRESKDVRKIGNVYSDISYNEENKTLVDGSLLVYDEESLEVAKEYLKAGSIDIDKLNSENGVIIIGKNRIFNPKTERTFYGPISDLRVGDEILLQSEEYQADGSISDIEFGEGKVNKVKVLAILDSNPFDFRGNDISVKMITTKDVASKLISQEINPVALNIKIKDITLEDKAKEEIENIISEADGLRLINIIDQNRNTKSIILMAKILLYGFVIVVSLIGSVNIINTLTTNIILRRREFASLKSIGLTQKGLRKMITLEGILYGIMGSFYGSIVGTILSYMLYRGIIDMREQSYHIPVDAILVAVAGAMFIGYISVLAPLRRMKKANLIDVVREDF